MRKRIYKTPSKSSPRGSRRGCLCPDGTYSTKCCDGSIKAQGIGRIQAQYDPKYKAILNESARNSYTEPSTTVKSLQNTFIEELRSYELWDKLDELYVFLDDLPDGTDTEDYEFNLMNWKNPSDKITVVQPTWLEKSSGTLRVKLNAGVPLRSPYEDNHASRNWTEDSITFGYEMVEIDGHTISSGIIPFGYNTVDSKLWLRQLNDTRVYYHILNDTQTTIYNTYGGWRESKLKIGARNSTTILMYEDDSLRGSTTKARTDDFSGNNMNICVGINGRHLNCKILFAGQYLTATEIGNLYTAWNTYKTAIG